MKVLPYEPRPCARIIIESGIEKATRTPIWLLTYIDADGYGLCVGDVGSAEEAYSAARLWEIDGVRVIDRTRQ